MELMEHQEEAIEKLSSGKILYGGTGTGKGMTVLGYYVKEEERLKREGRKPLDIYVITIAKKRDSLDWLEEAARFGISDLAEISRYGKITVDSWNNIGKYEDVEGAFFIFDEQRAAGTGKWGTKFIKIAKKNDWILLSATPGDNWLDYAPIFIANGFYKNITDFKRKHVLYEPYVKFPKVKGYLNEQRLEWLRNEILVEMPFLRHTTRYLNWMNVGYDVNLVKKVIKERWHIFEDRPIVDSAELFRVLRRIVFSDSSRLEYILELVKLHPKLIIFYNWDYELDILRSLNLCLPTYEYNGHVKDPVPVTDRWVYLVQYLAGAEAWNCTATDAMVLYSLTYSYKNFEQAQGRIDRLDTPFTDLRYYILVSNSVVDRAIRTALSSKKNFNERKFMRDLERIGGMLDGGLEEFATSDEIVERYRLA